MPLSYLCAAYGGWVQLVGSCNVQQVREQTEGHSEGHPMLLPHLCPAAVDSCSSNLEGSRVLERVQQCCCCCNRCAATAWQGTVGQEPMCCQRDAHSHRRHQSHAPELKSGRPPTALT